MRKITPQYLNLEESHIQILDRFSKGFSQVYRHMEPEKRVALLDLAPLLFQKWYASALVTETILSPANMITSDKRVSLLDDEVICYSLIIEKGQNTAYNFNFAAHIYSKDKHPMVADVKTILDYCQPDIAMEGDGQLTPSDAALLLPKLSQQDSAYLDYLVLLCWNIGFMAKLPSIYSSRMQPVKYEEFLELAPSLQLITLTDAALELAVAQMQDAMRLGFPFLSKELFRTYLQSAQDVDELFIDIFHQLDVDISDIWEQAATGNLSFDEASIMSSFYYMGVLLDKWLITPMSFYFHCLQPLYFTPFQFISTINNLTSLLIMESETDMELYTPCSHYTQTPIGLAVFGSSEAKVESHLIPPYIDFPQLVATVDHELLQEKRKSKKSNPPKEELIYTFKVKFIAFKRKWKIIEVFANSDLEAFCTELCGAFSLDDVMDYTLTTWDHNEYPLDFSPRASKRSVNKAHTKTLENLQLKIGERMIFAPSPDKNKQLTLDLTFIKAATQNPYILYPRIKKQSAYITEAEKMEDLF